MKTDLETSLDWVTFSEEDESHVCERRSFDCPNEAVMRAFLRYRCGCGPRTQDICLECAAQYEKHPIGCYLHFTEIIDIIRIVPIRSC